VSTLVKNAISIGVISIISLVIFELVFAFILAFPGLSLLPVELMRSLYEREYRNVIQSDPDCVSYDPELTYRLKASGCRFANLEFDTYVSANSAGLRDSEEALDAPQAIFLGDSVAMGWGVEDEETFPHHFEQRTGIRTLNAGISSYGTPRELMLLQQLDHSALEVVVIQYSANDVRETQQAALNGTLQTVPEADYWRIMNDYQERISYFPGRHTLVGVFYLLKGLRGTTGDIVTTSLAEEVDYLVTVLASYPLPSGARVLLFEQNECGRERAAFAPLLRDLLSERQNEQIEVLDFSTEIGDGLCFPIDGHINQAGHERIAELLAAAITGSAPRQ